MRLREIQPPTKVILQVQSCSPPKPMFFPLSHAPRCSAETSPDALRQGRKREYRDPQAVVGEDSDTGVGI